MSIRVPLLFLVASSLALPAACQKETAPVEEAKPASKPAKDPDKPASKPAKDPDKPVELKTEGVALLPKPAKTPDPLEKVLDGIIDSYLALKSALVKDDTKTAAAMAERVKALVESADASGLEGDAKKSWETLSQTIATSAGEIAGTQDLKAQRDHLFPLSEATYAAAWSFEHGKKPLFVQFCPMAHTDKGGAHWLSDDSKIRNPYWGDKMLECGEVRKVLR